MGTAVPGTNSQILSTFYQFSDCGSQFEDRSYNTVATTHTFCLAATDRLCDAPSGSEWPGKARLTSLHAVQSGWRSVTGANDFRAHFSVFFLSLLHRFISFLPVYPCIFLVPRFALPLFSGGVEWLLFAIYVEQLLSDVTHFNTLASFVCWPWIGDDRPRNISV